MTSDVNLINYIICSIMKPALVSSCFVVHLACLIAHVGAGPMGPSIAVDGRLALPGQTEVSHVAANVHGSSGRDLDPEDPEEKGRALSPGEKKRAERALKEVRKAEHAVDRANRAIKAHNEGLETTTKDPHSNAHR